MQQEMPKIAKTSVNHTDLKINREDNTIWRLHVSINVRKKNYDLHS